MYTHQVVDTDNFNGDFPNEKFVCIPSSEDICIKAANELNANFSGPGASRYYKVVKLPYTLQPGFEPCAEELTKP